MIATVVLILTTLDGGDSFQIMNKIIQITLHGQEQPWNEAQAVCESTGGYLLRLDSKEKQHALTHYQTSDPTWQQHSGGDKWFGLHALESSSNTYTWTYGKEACDEIENGTYIHWETGYPDKTSKKRCGKLPDGKGWKNTECKHDKKFLCEKQLDADCTFNFANLVKPKASLSVVSQFTGDSTHTACTNNCLNSATNDMNCWAATFNLLLGECVLYYSEDPFLLSQESNLEPSLLLYYTKQCFDASYENDATNIPSKSSFTSETPDEGCSMPIPVLSTTSTSTIHSSTRSTISSTQMANSTHADNSTISTHGTRSNPINAPFTTTSVSTQATTSFLSSTAQVTEATTSADSSILTIPSSASTGQSISSPSLQTTSSTTEHISTTATQGTTTNMASFTTTDISTQATTSSLSSTSQVSDTTTSADSSILTIPSSASTGQSISSSSLQTSSNTTEHISTTATQGTTTNIAPLTTTDISTQATTSSLSSTSPVSETTTSANSLLLTIPSSASTGQSIPSSSLQTSSSTTEHISTTATQETTTNMTTLLSTGLLTQATTNPGSSSTTAMATSLQTSNATTSMQTQETLGGTTTSSMTSSSSPSAVSSVVQHSTSIPDNGSVSINDTICTCLLTDINNLYKANSIDMDFALLTSEEKVEKLQKRLKINKATLSASIRKKTSVMDTRTESMTVGVVSITVLSMIFGGLFISDVASIYRGIRYGV